MSSDAELGQLCLFLGELGLREEGTVSMGMGNGHVGHERTIRQHTWMSPFSLDVDLRSAACSSICFSLVATSAC